MAYRMLTVLAASCLLVACDNPAPYAAKPAPTGELASGSASSAANGSTKPSASAAPSSPTSSATATTAEPAPDPTASGAAVVDEPDEQPRVERKSSSS